VVVRATDLGPARLRLAAEAAKREALMLASEWGTLLAPIPGMLEESFRSAFGDDARLLINGWEEDMNDLGNHLFDLSSACEAAADEEQAIAHVVAEGLAEPRRSQDLTAAFSVWEGRARQRRHIDFSDNDRDRFVAVDPKGVRRAAAKLIEASDEFDAARRRLEDPLLDVKLAAPEELSWVAQDSLDLAAELRRRADAYDEAEQKVQASAVRALSGPFSALLAPAAYAVGKAGTALVDPKRAKEEAKQLLEAVRPDGVLELADFHKARAILAAAERASSYDASYAVAFFEALGPKNLRWLLEHGQQDPCVLGSLAARASQAGLDLDFLKKTLGNDRFDAPRRAAVLSQCPRPTAQYDASWVNTLAVTLLRGRDRAGPGDPRRWYREAAASLLRANPLGAVTFINANEGLACRALFSHDDKGGRAAQAGLEEMLFQPLHGRAKEADQALQRAVTCAERHEFSREGKVALANLLSRPETYRDLTLILLERRPPGIGSRGGFRPDFATLQNVLSDLMADEEARRILTARASQFAGEQVRAYLADRSAPGATHRLEQAGAAFGALASRPYSLSAAIDIHKMAAATAKDLVGTVRGATLNVAKANPVVSLAIEGGSAVLFDATDAFVERQAIAEELRVQRDSVTELSRLHGQLTNNLEHLAYVSVLADPEEHAALHLRLSTDDVPSELPDDRHLSVSTREDWIRDLFDDEGRLFVALPSHADRWTSFRGWVHTVNPQLYDRVSEMTEPMFDAFHRASRPA